MPQDVEDEETPVGTSSLRAGRAPVTLRVPFAASSVSVARQQLKAWMLDGGIVGDVVEDARVVISELVANSVRHAQPLPDGDILVSWKMATQGLQISVTDGGSGTRPRKVNAPSSALAGRGMAIVETLAATWWSDKTRSRSTVHAVLAV
jgi:anti-sigma regulatory factor (Ser/Thr protein kinase)